IQAKERNSQELAEELGFEILNGNRHLGLARYGFVENGGQEKISSDDAWNFDNSQWMASGYADRKLILNNEDSTLLHMSEDKKKLVIKKVSDDEYQITYSLMGDISKYVGSDSDLHVFKYESETRVKRESSGEYLVLSSQMTFSNKRSGDAEYFRVMSAGVTDPQTMFRLKISNCPRAEGRLQASYSGRYQGQLEVEFTAQNIRQISGRGGSLVEDLPLCGASLWSIVNLSSFL